MGDKRDVETIGRARDQGAFSPAMRDAFCDKLQELGLTDADLRGVFSGLGDSPCRTFIAEIQRISGPI